LTEYITVPVSLLKELHEGLAKVEEVLATLKELANKEGLERIKEAEQEYNKGKHHIFKNSEEIQKKLQE